MLANLVLAKLHHRNGDEGCAVRHNTEIAPEKEYNDQGNEFGGRPAVMIAMDV